MVESPRKQAASGAWTEFKGKLRQKWGQITEDELDKYEGRRQELEGLVERTVGEERVRIRDEVERASRESGYRF